MRDLSRVLAVLVAAFLILPESAIVAGSAGREEGGPPAPPARVLQTLDLPGEMQWYYQNDVGMLLVYAGGRLHRFDLLDGKPEALDAIEFPELSRPWSVVPIARTGLLLIPDAPAGMLASREGGAASSYALDTLGGRLLWEAPPLPSPGLVFSFPDIGLAVLRSFADGGSLTAVDLRTGERKWGHAMPMETVWYDGLYIRLISEKLLLTLDISTGETIRRDELTLPKTKLIRAFPAEGVLIAWSNKSLKAFSMPPAPPAEAAPARPMWEFTAASPMMDLPIRTGDLYIERIEEDLLLVKSVRHYELLKLSTGKLVLDVKQGLLGFKMPLILPPGGEVIAVAENEGLQVHDGDSGELIHEIRYPKGREGLKTARQIRWLGEDVIATVFPDKGGNPRRMSAFSSSKGTLLWSLGLPEAADYELTSKQRAQLIGRITMSLFATAASVGHPMSVGGTNYAVVLLPDLAVSVNLDAGRAMGRATAAGDSGAESPFAYALDRVEECNRRMSPAATGHSYFATGPEGKYEILRIGFEQGDVTPIASYDVKKVHSIAFFPGFKRAMSVENDNRRVRLISLE